MRMGWRVGLIAAVLVGVCVFPTPVVAKFNLKSVLSMSDAAKAKLPDKIRCQAIHKYGLKAVAMRRDFVKEHNRHYEVTVPGGGAKVLAVRDQQESGNCWIFGTERVLRGKLYKQGKKVPKLSTSFVNYHALRQCSHALLDKAARRRKPMNPSVGDADEGGFQPWAIDIIRRQGIVPEKKMPATFEGEDPEIFLNQLQTLVAKAQCEISKDKAGPRSAPRLALVRGYKRQVDDLLEKSIGKPPREITVKGKRYTPRTYASKYLGLEKQDLRYVTLTHDPTREFNRRHRSESYAGMPTFAEYNVRLAVIERTIKETLQRGEVVLFGINSSSANPFRATGDKIPKKAQGVLSIAAFDYTDLVAAPKLSKRERIKAKITEANHVMVITGYDTEKDGSVRKWQVQNSHGEDVGDKGYFHMYNDFFREYVEEVVVPRKFVPKKLLEKLERRPMKK